MSGRDRLVVIDASKCLAPTFLISERTGLRAATCVTWPDAPIPVTDEDVMFTGAPAVAGVVMKVNWVRFEPELGCFVFGSTERPAQVSA